MRAEPHDRTGETGTRRPRPLLFVLMALAVLAVLPFVLQLVLRWTTPAPQGVDPARSAPARDAPAAPADVAPEPPSAARPAELPGEPPAAPLPALEHSDPEVRATLGDVLPAAAQPVLAPDELLRRAAALAAGLARGRLMRDKLPLPAPAGKLVVSTREDRIYLAEANFARYNALADAVAELDTDALARWFGHYEPLLAEAWKELGAEGGDPRGALIAGLDLMLAAPEIHGEIELVQPAVFYKYADPALEALPQTQKLLIRVGPANRQVIKERARRLRDALAAQP